MLTGLKDTSLALLEPIRLIIWDLDGTFWKGTLTEGGISAFIEENHALIPVLARRGIMSSICSKNDHDTVRAILQEHGLWDYFIFPSINWLPKGARIATIIKTVGLRPSTVLFIDDNPNNRGEVAQAVPDIAVADETFIASITEHTFFQGKDDAAMTRLAQYKLLERKKEDENRASDDDGSFLRGCDIRVTIEHDLERHLDRVVELVNRTNQLNFTKQRLPEDQEQARAEALKQIRYFGHQGGLVKVSDRYGDYGYVGFYLKTLDEGTNAGTLKHFCFSCRTLGMGIEQWVYQTLGRPWLTVVGDVLSDVYNAAQVNWVNQSGGGAGTALRLHAFTEIRMRGGCEISALAHYFKVAGLVTCVETNFARDMFVIKLDTAASLLNALAADVSTQAALARLSFPPESLFSAFFAPVSGPTLLVLNLWGELHVPAHRHKKIGFYAHLVLDGFMGWGDGHAGGDIGAWTDAQLATQARSLRLDPSARGRVAALAAELRSDYVFAGPLTEAEVKASLRAVADRIPARATLVLIQPACGAPDGTANYRNTEWTRWCRDELADRPNVLLIDIDQSIHSFSEHIPNMGDHFDRIVYYRVAKDIMDQVTALAETVELAGRN